MKKTRILAAAIAAVVAALAPLPALADLTIGVSISLDRADLGARHPDAEGHRALAEGDRRREAQRHPPRRRDRSDQGRAEHEKAHHRGQGRRHRRLGDDAGGHRDGRRLRRGQDAAAHALAGQPAARQGRVVVPHAAVDRGDGDPDRRAVEEARRQDLRLPRLLRRLRRGLAHRHQAAGRQGRHQARRHRALRAQRYLGHRPGAEARRRQPRRDPRRRLRQRRGDAAQGVWSSAATRRARSTRRTARRRWT